MRLLARLLFSRPVRALVVLTASLVFAGTTAAIAYVLYESRSLPSLRPLEYGEVATWKQHTSVYSDVAQIRQGAKWKTVQRRLERLAYHSVPAGGLVEGTYAVVSADSDGPEAVVFTRPFAHPAVRQPPQRFTLRFHRGELVAVEREDGSRAATMYLEPELVDELYNVDEGLARQLIRLDQVPKALIHAVLAIEDNEFYSHPGIHARRFAVTMLNNVLRGEMHGASTITQQLARNLMLTKQKIVSRKVKEWLLAVQIERRFSKDEILERYLNFINLGRYAGRELYGVKEAARYYFDRDASDLTAAECALLAGIPKSPTAYSPVLNPDRALARRDLVLRQMLRRGYLSRDEYAQARQEVLRIVAPTRRRNRGSAPYFTAYVRTLLDRDFSADDLYSRGMRVYTTLDPIAQEEAEKAISNRLRELDRALGYPPYADAVRAEERGEVPRHPTKDYLQAALVMLDAQTGAIHAMVGGRDFERNEYNHAVPAKRQPGSAFKPFVYTAAFEHGMTPESTVLDEPWTYRGWTPHNIDFEYEGRVPLRRALVRSLNVATARLMNEYVGVEPVIAVARRMGVESPLRPFPALALGASEVTLLELTSAYGVFANQGIRVPPLGVRYVVTTDGVVRQEGVVRPERALDERIAATTTSVLQDVIRHGTGYRVRKMGFTYSAAGKTGTTSEYTDAWFVGFTPHYVTGVWVGFDDPKKSVRRTGSDAAAPIWADFMMAVVERDEAFAAPPRRASTRAARRRER